MPAKSPKQQRFMGMCAHSKKAPKVCPPKDVAREFSRKPAGGYKKKKAAVKDPRDVTYY